MLDHDNLTAHPQGRNTVGHARQMLGQFKMNGQWVDYHFDKVGVAHNGKNWIAIFGKQSGSDAG